MFVEPPCQQCVARVGLLASSTPDFGCSVGATFSRRGPRKSVVVRWACSAVWGSKSPAQPDGGEGLVITQGLSSRGAVGRKRGSNGRVDGQAPAVTRGHRAGGLLTAMYMSCAD